MTAKLETPRLLQQFYAHFPLKTLPDVPLSSTHVPGPVLWIVPPREANSPLSADVDCLAAQTLVALHGKRVTLRTDISAEGGVGKKLSTLQDENDKLLGSASIANWVGVPLEQDEARAWLALLESSIRPALLLHAPPQSWLEWARSRFPDAGLQWKILLSTPPPPVTGIASPLPTLGTRLDAPAIRKQFATALHALAERLGRDTWFLCESEPTVLDAKVFAFLHAVSEIPQLRTELDAYPALTRWVQSVGDRVVAQFTS